MKKIVKTMAARFLLEGLPVEEAEADMLLVPNEADCANAVAGDPDNCIFAQTAKRCFGSGSVKVLNSHAYIDLPGENGGSRYFKRFVIPTETRFQIEQFDATGKFDRRAYVLKAPPLSETLEHKQNGRLNPRSAKKNPKEIAAKRRRTIAFKKRMGIRNGTGSVHLTKASAA
jgi:hypothetical protein